MSRCYICKDIHKSYNINKIVVCDTFFTEIIRKHIDYFLSIGQKIQIEKPKKKYSYSFKCEKCNKILTSITNYKKHIETFKCVKSKEYKCDKCNKNFRDKRNLDYHIENDVCDKKANTQITNTINNTMNTANNIQQNIQNQNVFNITVNSTEDLKKVVELIPFRDSSYRITPEKYLEYANNPEQAVTKFVKDEHLNPAKPERMNILNTNPRSNRVQLFDYDDNFVCRWMTKDKATISELLADRGMNTLFFAKDNLARAGIKLDPKKEAKIKEKIKEYETNDKVKKMYIDKVSDLTYDYRKIVEENKKKSVLSIKN
jgi:hypothetical protein